MATIRADLPRKLLLIEVDDFMASNDEVGAFFQRLQSEAAKIGVRRAFHILVDLRRAPLQPRDVVDGMTRLSQSKLATGKIAIVIESALATRQVRRIAGAALAPDQPLFETIEAAERWLASQPVDQG